MTYSQIFLISKIGIGEISHLYWFEFASGSVDLTKNFTLIETMYLIKIKNSIAKRMYIMLKNRLDLSISKNENIGYYSINTETLLEKLGYNSDSSYYKNFNDFYKRVLLPTQSQINENTDIKILITVNKHGTKKIKKIDFRIKINSALYKKSKDYIDVEIVK